MITATADEVVNIGDDFPALGQFIFEVETNYCRDCAKFNNLSCIRRFSNDDSMSIRPKPSDMGCFWFSGGVKPQKNYGFFNRVPEYEKLYAEVLHRAKNVKSLTLYLNELEAVYYYTQEHKEYEKSFEKLCKEALLILRNIIKGGICNQP